MRPGLLRPIGRAGLLRPIGLRHLHRWSSTLRLLTPRAATSDSRPTVYCTGFLTHTSDDGNYSEWLACHQRLGESLGWCAEAHGVDWRTGSGGDIFGRWPLPLHVATLLLRRSSPAAFAYGLAGDALLNAARIYRAYRAAEDAAQHDAPTLAAALSKLAQAPHVESYRVVAHSLGCRLLVDALPLLPPDLRPAEVHLCAAAMTATHAAPKLAHICRPGGHVYHFWSAGDEALSSGFLLASGGERALGSMPLPTTAATAPSAAAPPPPPPSSAAAAAAAAASHAATSASSHAATSASSHDATSYLGVASHGAFRAHFHQLARDAVLGRPPPPRKPWLDYQQAHAANVLTSALRRLPASLPAVRYPRGGAFKWPRRRGAGTHGDG